jgi:hypothetical protein
MIYFYDILSIINVNLKNPVNVKKTITVLSCTLHFYTIMSRLGQRLHIIIEKGFID